MSHSICNQVTRTMLDILLPAASKLKSTSPPVPASPTASPASSTSTLKASSSSHPSSFSSRHVESSSTSADSASAVRSKGQQARRQTIQSAVASSHRRKYAGQDDSLEANLVDPSSTSRSSPGLVSFRQSASASGPFHAARQTRGRLEYPRSRRAAPSADPITRSTTSLPSPSAEERGRTPKRSRTQTPLLGGLYFSDLIVVGFFYAVNLLRTCGIAELVDVAFKAFTYICTRLPFDFYQRWSLSRAPPTEFGRYAPLSSASTPQHHDSHRLSWDKRQSAPEESSILSEKTRVSRSAQFDRTSLPALSLAASASDDDKASQEASDDDAQLSPFHHLTLLLVRFACTSFPHLVPRVLFAEETIGPLVRWRTGGGAAGIVREFTSEQLVAESHGAKASAAKTEVNSRQSKAFHTYTRPGFRAFWIGADAHVPVEVRRSDPSSKSATTLLYLHGGGFSLGSVAFYAEALIRITTKVCQIEDHDNDARCVAVEYDLAPTSRFPGPLLQCLRCYAHLVEVEGIDPNCITIAGDSAGGNLAMAMLLCLDGQARSYPALGERDWGALPLPGKTVLISPWADLRPSVSLAFAPLREAAATGTAQSPSRPPDTPSSDPEAKCLDETSVQANVRVSAWTEAIGQHEWDYVAAEALMHFAQLYAGVLKTPRRVRGPMGWVAHLCAVLAGDEVYDANAVPTTPQVRKGKSEKPTSASINATAPLAILRTLLSPPQRMARAAHSILTEPLLNRASSAKAPPSSPSRPGQGTLNQIDYIRAPASGALDPIFPATERKTDAVPTTADLYIPIWDFPTTTLQKKEGDEEAERKEEERHRRAKNPDFEAAKDLLEKSKLINPAIGDWSRIRLKHGMLVVWGDRERLAADIKVWIDHVRRSQTAQSGRTAGDSDDQPSQDSDPAISSSGLRASSLQERRAASRSPHRLPEELPEHAADWLCTAVEHGPSGVHAWPFVSMYLAGAEAEREKGLEIIARFIAEPAQSPVTTQSSSRSSPVSNLAVQLPAHDDQRRYLSTSANSPPHLNAVSPAGSMPSDISSRGDADDHDFPFLGSSYTESEGWHHNERNELGLDGVYPHETLWTEPTSTPSTGVGTPLSGDAERSSFGHDELVRRVGLGLGDAPSHSDNAATIMPVHLTRPTQSSVASWGQYGAPHTDTQRAGTRKPSTTVRSATAQTLGGPIGGRSLADLEAESDMSAPPSRPDSPPSHPESPGWRNDSAGYGSHDDDLADPSPSEFDREAYFDRPVSYADDAIPMDPGFYGLAHYQTLRPEGLSDIAEEESQLDTSSVLSSGHGAGGALSPGLSDAGLSPVEGASPNVGATTGWSNPGRHSAAYTPSAAEMARLKEALDERERQYRQRFAQRFDRGGGGGGRKRFPIEEDEDDSIGEESDLDSDHLDIDDRHGSKQHQISPWRSSAELPNLSQPEAEDSGTPVAAQRIGLDRGHEGSRPHSTRSGAAELQAPPSPTRSTSSRSSSAHDVWW